MQNHEFEWWGKDRQYRPCFGTIEKQLKTRDGLSNLELQKRVITLLNVLKNAEIPLHIGAMAYSVYKWQQSEYFHIKYFMKPEVYVNKYWPRYFSTIDPPNMEKLKENFSVDYYGDKLRILYDLIENGGVNKLGEHLIYAKTDPSLMATGPVVLFNKEPVTCNNLTVLYHTRILYHTRMVHTVRVWYVPYAYGTILYTIRVWYVPYAYNDILRADSIAIRNRAI